VELLKKNLLILDYNEAEFPSTTFGAVPVIRQILKGSSGRGLGSGFSIFRIIDVITDLTLVSFHGNPLLNCHKTVFVSSAVRTEPDIWQVFKFSSRGSLIPWLTRFSVVDITTNFAFVSAHLTT